MRILVTGGAGYLGSVLCPMLLEAGHDVTVVDDLLYRQESLLHVAAHPRFTFVRGDVRDRPLMSGVLTGHDVIVPLAAIVGAPACDRHPDLARGVNLEAVRLLMELKSRDQRVVFATTNSGYGIGEREALCTEESPLRPVSLYGVTKVQAEEAVRERGNAAVLRLATVFGVSPRMRTDLLVNDFVIRAMMDRSIVLFEEHFRRNFIHIRDVGRTILWALEHWDTMCDQVYNVGLSSANLSKRELCERIKTYCPTLVVFSSSVGEDPDKRDYIVSNAKLEATGWRPALSLDDGIRELINAMPLLRLQPHSNL